MKHLTEIIDKLRLKNIALKEQNENKDKEIAELKECLERTIRDEKNAGFMDYSRGTRVLAMNLLTT